MSNTFSVTMPKGMSLDEGVAKVRKGITDAGGKYAFDGKNGSFSLKGVHGTFVVEGKIITITISKKPFIVSHKYIENLVTDYVAIAHSA